SPAAPIPRRSRKRAAAGRSKRRRSKRPTQPGCQLDRRRTSSPPPLGLRARGDAAGSDRTSAGERATPRLQPADLDHLTREVDHALVRLARALAEHLERRVIGDPVPLHQDALGALDRRPALERALEAVDFITQCLDVRVAVYG